MKSKSSTTTKKNRPALNLPPIHPGEILAGELRELRLSAGALARALDVPPNRISEIIAGRRALSADTALRLARYFGTGAKFWMNLQQSYDLALAEQKSATTIKQRVRPWEGRKNKGNINNLQAAW